MQYNRCAPNNFNYSNNENCSKNVAKAHTKLKITLPNFSVYAQRKSSIEILQNLPNLTNTKTPKLLFPIFHVVLLYSFSKYNSLAYVQIDQGIH